MHPYIHPDSPAACRGSLPPVLAPFLPANHVGDALRREDPWTMLLTAADALGWRAPRSFPLPYGWEDETLMRSLGVHLDASEPGHRGIDLVGALAWERSVGAGLDPGWSGAPPPHHDPTADVISRLVDLARADPTATIEDLALAVQDRVIQEPAWTDPDHRREIEALLALPLAGRAAAHDRDILGPALRRLAGALLMSPQFTLAGLAPPPWTAPPRLVLPEATTAALCARLLAELPADLDLTCDDAELPRD